MIQSLRNIPSIETLLQDKSIVKLYECIPRVIVAELVKREVNTAKNMIAQGQSISVEKIINGVERAVEKESKRAIGRVINATGIVVHTNLGRAPLSDDLFDQIKNTVTGYGNIEFDLLTGKRGGRGELCEYYLSTLAGSESATIVNNCAAAIFLILNTLANRKEVLLSRGEMVQIGGGFRIPDILKKSGAKLHEVGSTNITTIDDYDQGIDTGKVSMILKVHQSNFIQRGFTQQASLKDIIALARKHKLVSVNDLGSGVFVKTKDLLGYDEPTVQQSVRSGADLTCFSGDKLLGGVQAGLIVGKADLIKKIKRNPLFRTMRADKITFALMERLLTIYLNGSDKEDIKLWALLHRPESQLYLWGKQLLQDLGDPKGIAVEATRAFVGGGALPESAIPSVGLVFDRQFKARQIEKSLRQLTPSIIGRIEDDCFILDLKAIDENDLPYLTDSIKKAIG